MKGILFKPDNIQAIVEGRKTQTRRLIKPQPKQINNDFDGTWEWKEKGHYYDDLTLFTMLKNSSRYHAGETVYIKEAHYRYGHWVKNGLTKTGKQQWRFKAFTHTIYYADNPPSGAKPNSYRQEAWYKRSPLFMPEWAARHFIKILAVRAERLQEITYGDCIKEGLDMSDVDYCPGWDVGKFKSLWDSINPKYLWESNPWVFPYEFEFIKGGK